ncbi:MAG: ChaN family lipoprotein [Blastocatellia bacterium]
MQKLFWSLLTLVFLVSIFTLTAAAQQPSGAEATYVPQRTYLSGEKKFSDFETMLAELARADVVFVGEQHDDPNTHRLERAVLEGLLRRRGSAPVVVALEMFERDVQPVLDDYLAGKITEDEFLKKSRPWPRYATDYRPIIELAKIHGWRVIAGNVPRRYASQVARSGIGEVDKLPAEERGFVAKQMTCPMDDYYKKFVEAMSGHPGQNNGEKKEPDEASKAMIEKVYQAQCIKDETMAESIAAAWQNASGQKPLIVHYNGAFHSDYRLGTAARTIQRLPGAKVKVVSVIPVEDLDNVKPDEYRERGDYLVFTLKPKHAKSEK